jgi:hypothetical protein
VSYGLTPSRAVVFGSIVGPTGLCLLRKRTHTETPLCSGFVSHSLRNSALAEYIKRSELAGRVYAAAITAGFQKPENLDYDVDTIDPHSTADLGWAGVLVGFRTINQLDQALKAEELVWFDYFRALIGKSGERQWGAGQAFSILLVVILHKPAVFTTENLVSRGWSDAIAERVVSTALELRLPKS